MPTGGPSGVRLAVGILLLWFGLTCLFIAFMSGKTGSLTSHVNQEGKPVGPRDASELAVRLAENVQAAAAAGSSDSSSSGSSSAEV